MINRILIRIKVAQMLYSYLLTRSEFKIEQAPETSSKERKYAYQIYCDMLLLILELSGYKVKSGADTSSPLDNLKGRNPLHNSKLAASLASDNNIKDLILLGNNNISSFDSIVLRLHQTILSTQAYIDYRKPRTRDLADDVKFWTVILRNVITKDVLVQEILRRNPEYSGSAFTKGINMVVDTLTHYNDTRSMLIDARKSLEASLEKAYELYHGLLILPVAITREEELRIDDAKHKYLPTDEDLNPNTRFINNAYVKAISENIDMEDYLKSHAFSWDGDYYMIKDLLEKIRESEIYKEYMAAPTTDFANDVEVWRRLMRSVILPSDALADTLESKSVFWNDDLDIMGTFAVKTMKQIALAGPDAQVKLLPMFKDEEDAEFGAKLFSLAVENREIYREYIDQFVNSEQWDSERIPFMDIVVLIAAIAELINFPSIPVAVTVNEYIEIAKSYSTAKSGQFVNGILYTISTYLKEEGIINK